MGLLPRIIVAALALQLGGASAIAQNAPSKPLPSTVLEELNDPSYAKRLAATRRLLADDSVDPEAVAALYAKATTPEQRNRLIDIARHHFIRKLRLQQFPGARLGALGVIQSAMPAEQLPKVGRPAARVVATLPGFPAYAALEAGDLVLEVNGEGLPAGLSAEDTSSHFGRMIIDHRQGSVIDLLIWRGGATMKVSVRLASSDAIRNMFEPTNQRLQPQHRGRWLRFFDRMVDTKPDRAPTPVDLTPTD